MEWVGERSDIFRVRFINIILYLFSQSYVVFLWTYDCPRDTNRCLDLLCEFRGVWGDAIVRTFRGYL